MCIILISSGEISVARLKKNILSVSVDFLWLRTEYNESILSVSIANFELRTRNVKNILSVIVCFTY